MHRVVLQFPGLLCLAVPSPLSEKGGKPCSWALGLCCLCSLWSSVKVWLSSCAQVKGRSPQQSSVVSQCGLGTGSFPSHHSCLARPCAGSGPYGQVRHLKTGRQLQVGESPPAISLLFCTFAPDCTQGLVWGSGKHLCHSSTTELQFLLPFSLR